MFNTKEKKKENLDFISLVKHFLSFFIASYVINLTSFVLDIVSYLVGLYT